MFKELFLLSYSMTDKHEYYLNNRQKIIERAIKFNKENPEKCKQYRKTYYNKNKEKYAQYGQKLIYCEYCDTHYKTWNITKHKNTKKHKENMTKHLKNISNQ